MKVSAVLVTLIAAVAALDKRTVDPAQATASLIAALPQSVVSQLATASPAAQSSILLAQFSTGTPGWFASLPGEVQTYFQSAASAAGATPSGSGSGSASATASSSGNALSSISSAASSALSSLSSDASSIKSSASAAISGASSSSSSAGAAAAWPTAVMGSGILGAVGVIGMIAL